MSAVILEDIFEFWTPTEVKTYVATVAAGYNALASDIASKPDSMSEAETKAWTELLGNFIKFYKGMGFFSTLSMGAVRTAETFAAQLAFWRQIYQARTGAKPTGAPVVIPTQNQDKVLDTVRLVAIAGGVFAVGYIVSQVLDATKPYRRA